MEFIKNLIPIIICDIGASPIDGDNFINELFNNTLKIIYTPGQKSNFHYKITPYSFTPDMGKKLTLSTFTDMGQGLLQCAQKMSAENIKNNG